MINQKFAVQYRDELVANAVGALAVTKIVDIGCDFGSLLFACRKAGIEGIGLDPSQEAITLCHDAGLAAVQGRYQDLGDEKSPVRKEIENFLGSATGKTAIAVLNILHAEKKRSPLLMSVVQSWPPADYFVVTAHRGQLKNLKRLGLRVHSKIGAQTRTPRLWKAHVLQYGRTFFFGGSKLADSLEDKFWEVIRGRLVFPDKLSVYSQLVVILTKIPGRAIRLPHTD